MLTWPGEVACESSARGAVTGGALDPRGVAGEDRAAGIPA